MKLEWFRQHKRFVYWVLLPVVGIGMAFFGATSAFKMASTAQRGPWMQYRANPEEGWHYLSSSEVMALRYVLTQYLSGMALTRDAAYHEVAWHAAAAAGFEVGNMEMRDELCDEIKRRTEQPSASDKLYRKLLTSLQLTAEQFEDMTREIGLRTKLARYLQNESKANDEELYVAYAQEKETVRLRFKEFKSEELLAKGKEQSKETVRKCYDKYMELWEIERKGPGQRVDQDTFDRAIAKEKDDFRRTYKVNFSDLTDALIAKPKLSADMVFLDIGKLTAGDIKPEESALKTFYDSNKAQWKIEPKPGETPPAPGKEQYKPFEEVKAEVETKWKEKELKDYYDRNKDKTADWKVVPKPGDPPPKAGEEVKPFDQVKADVEKKWEAEKRKDRAMRRMSTLQKDEAEAEAAYTKEQQARPEAERKPFDLAAWVAKWANDQKLELVYWSTNELTEAQYKAGKKEIRAPDAGWAADLFRVWEDPSVRIRGRGAEQYVQMMRKMNRESRGKFSMPKFTEPGAKEQGVVLTKTRKYIPDEARPFDDVSEAVARQLKIGDGAEQTRAEWAEGKVPPLDSLDEIRGDKLNTEYPLFHTFFAAPKAIGEALDVAVKPVDAEKPEAGLRYFLGFAVERVLPTPDSFNLDTAWKRDDKRKEMEQSQAYSRMETLRRQMVDLARWPRDIREPAVFDERRGGAVPDDDY